MDLVARAPYGQFSPPYGTALLTVCSQTVRVLLDVAAHVCGKQAGQAHNGGRACTLWDGQVGFKSPHPAAASPLGDAMDLRSLLWGVERAETTWHFQELGLRSRRQGSRRSLVPGKVDGGNVLPKVLVGIGLQPQPDWLGASGQVESEPCGQPLAGLELILP